MKSSRKSTNWRRNTRSRRELENRKLLRGEKLESRVMLTLDTGASLQNQDYPQDVDGDNQLAPIDALLVINDLNQNGSRQVSADMSKGGDQKVAMLDVDGDNFVSPLDALHVIDRMNNPDSEGEGTKVLFSIDVTDLAGNSLTTVQQGDQFNVNVSVRDVRMGTRLGVFAAYLDVMYDKGVSTVDLKENQRVQITGGPFTADSTFTLTLNNETTAPIAHNASEADVKAALEALPSIAENEIEVFLNGTSNWKVRFGGSLANMDIADLTADISNVQTDPNDQFAVPPTLTITEINKGNLVRNPTDADYAAAFLQSLSPSTPYTNNQTGIDGNRVLVNNQESFTQAVNDPNMISEVGSIAGLNDSAVLGSIETLFLTAQFTANQSSNCSVVTQFKGDPADSIPASHVLLYTSGGSGTDLIVDPADIIYGTRDLTVENAFCAVNDTLMVAEDTSDNTVAVLTNDILNVGSSASIDTFGQGANGSVAIGPNETLEYTPNPDFFGTDSFDYTGIDDLGNSDGATVNVTISEINDMPVVVDDSFSTPEDTDLDIDIATELLNDDNAGPLEGTQTIDLFSFDGTTTAGGTVVQNNGTLTYSPPSDFFGSDTFTYTIEDNGTTNGASDPLMATGTVTIMVTEVNDLPTAVTDTLTTPEDMALTFDLGGLLTNDSRGPGNESGQTLIVKDIDLVGNQGGTIAVNGSAVYTPPLNFFGTETFSYTIEDDGTTNGGSDPMEAIGSLDIIVTKVNDVPTASDDTFGVIQDTVGNILDLVDNDSPGPQNEVLFPEILVATDLPSQTDQGGTLVDNGDGTVTYSPPAGFFGIDTFTYTATDDGCTDDQPDPMTSEVANVTINVDPPRLPLARDDAFMVDEGSAVIDVLALVLSNDLSSKPNNISVIAVTSPAIGTTSLNGVLNYQPELNFNGTDTFEYTIDDDDTETNEGPDIGEVTVTVKEINDAPAGVGDTVTAFEDTVLMIAGSTLVANDSKGPANESGQTLTVTGADATSAQGGTITFANGTISYTPPTNYNGPDSFDYTFTDNGTSRGIADPLTSSATVDITVDEVNDVPSATDNGGFTTAEDMQLDISDTALIGDDSKGPANEDSQVLRISAVSPMSAEGGTVSFANGVVSYVPPLNFNGMDTFTYTATDNGTTSGVLDEKSDTATVMVTVTEVNNDPILADDDAPPILILKDGGPQDIFPLGNDVPGPANESGQNLTIVSVQIDPADGTVVIAGDGKSFTYDPPDGFDGPVQFEYTATDDGTTDGAPDPLTATANIGVDVVEFVRSDVGGSVYYDTNGNGDRDPGEPGISGVSVHLSGLDIRGDTINRLPATTDRNGDYLFAGLVPGDYDVEADQVRYINDGEERLGPQPSGAIGGNDLFVDINLPIFGPQVPQETAVGNLFGERGFLATYIGGLFPTFTSASNNGLFVGTNSAGDQFWHMILGGWDNIADATIMPNGSLDSATIEVTTTSNTVHSTTITTANRRFYMGHDDSGGAVYRFDGEIGDLFPSLAQNGDGEAEGEAGVEELDEALMAVLATDRHHDFAAAVDQLMSNMA